jgi:prepilin signal peptidase PulO-like enzyme (type II secretory pathway)
LVAAAILGFAFVWGAMLGSFLNVVAHRVPRGRSVVGGGSRCPRCNAAIRPWHNVPVFGWLMLRGRCRDCAAPIAARYPLVEAGCGLLVAAAAAVDLLAGGIDRVLVWGDWIPVARFAFHGFALLTLVAWGLLAESGHRVSRVATAAAVAATGLVSGLLPAVQPVGVLLTGAAWPAGRPTTAAVVAWLAGTAAGWVGGRWYGRDAHAMLTLLGAAFGWQAVAIVTLLAVAGRRVGPEGAEKDDLPP